MKRKHLRFVLPAVVLIGLSCALFLLRSQPAEEEKAPQAEKTYLVGGEASPAPEKIAVKNENGNFAIINKTPDAEAPELTIEGWEGFSLDSYALGGALNAAKAMEIKQVISENPAAGELLAFGLDSPRASLAINSKGSLTELEIGNDAPGGEGAYVKLKGAPAVYLVGPSSITPFTRPAAEYINKAVTETDADFKSFDKLVITGSDYPEPIVIERSPETEIAAGGMTFGTHRVTSPIEAGLSMDAMERLNTIYGITAEAVEAAGADAEGLAEFGLDKPQMSIDVTGDQSFALRISKGEDGNIYLIKSGAPIVYKLSEASLTWYGIKLFDIMERMPLLPNIDTVSEVGVKTPEKTFTFTLSGEGDELKAVYEGNELDIKNFKQFYQTLISARYEEEIPQPEAVDETASEITSEDTEQAAENEAPGGEAGSNTHEAFSQPTLLEIEYRYKDGKAADTVKFYPGPVRRAVMSVNGGKPYYTTSAYVERVISDTPLAAFGEEVKSYF